LGAIRTAGAATIRNGDCGLSRGEIGQALRPAPRSLLKLRGGSVTSHAPGDRCDRIRSLLGKKERLMKVRLVENGRGSVLTPLGVSGFAELSKGDFTSPPHVTFEIEVPAGPVDRLSVRIRSAAGVVLQRELPPPFRQAGSHRWDWDGFDQSDVLDTRALRSTFELEFRSELRGAAPEVQVIKVTGHRHGQSWVDVAVDRKQSTARVELRLELREGGSYGIGEPPPKDAQKTSYFRNLPKGDPRSGPHVRARSFWQLQQLALGGVRRHWSQSIQGPAGALSVDVLPVLTESDAVDDVSIAYNTNRGQIRSSNPGSVRGVYSFFGNLVPERIGYNVGWIKQSGWVYVMPADADRQFAETAAHELGHEVLSAYGGDAYSYGHRGSSTVITQSTRAVGRGGQSYPAAGPIDLMKYYSGAPPAGYHSLLKASEQDVRALFWLAQVAFRA
jgi:hypothetical protein